MKQYLRTISVVVAVLAVVFALQAPTALAGASFNNDSQDNPTLEVSNHTTNPGNIWHSSISDVEVGDVVSFLFYYHNTGNETAHNTKARLSFNTSGSRVTANGTISADNASSAGRSVTVNAKSNNVFTGMTFHSALWYPNQDSNNPDPLPNGQTGSTVTGGGVNLGDITPGWSSQGYLVVRFTVQGYTNGGGSAPTVNLQAYYNGSQVSRVVKGTAVELRWNSTNATECHKLAGAGFETGGATSGSDIVSPLAGDTTFSIQCTGPGGSKNANASVTVLNPNIEFRATLNGNTVTQVPRGTAPTLYWTSNASTCQAIAGAGFATGGAGSGNDLVSPLNGDTTFSMRCSGFSAPGDPVQKNLTVTVSAGGGYNTPPSVVTKSAINITSHGAQIRGTINPNGTASDYWFTYGLSPSSLNSPTSMVSVGSGTAPVEVSKDLNNLGLSPNTTYYFQIIGRNAHGITHGAVLSFHTLSEQDPSDVPAVQTNAATNVAQHSAQLNASVNPNGKATSYWFEWGTTNNLGQSTSHLSAGSGNSSQNVSSSISGLSENTTYYFRIVAENSHGRVHGSTLSLRTTSSGGGGQAPYAVTNNASNIASQSAQLNASVTPNGASTSYWFEYGTSQSLGLTTPLQNAGSATSAQSVSSVASNLQENTTYYFRVVAQNSYGRVEGSVLSFSTTTNNNGGVPLVTTSPATGVSQNSAILNGTVNPNGNSTTYWFEYGTSAGFGLTTPTTTIGSGTSSQNVTKSVSGLSNNTTYYFRTVAQNAQGTAYGSTMTFVTSFSGGNNAPWVQTDQATNIDDEEATLQGRVDPNGASTSYWFEYGSSYSMGLTTPLYSLGSGNGDQYVSYRIRNLSSDHNYYFRVVAMNNYGTTYGNVESFRTDDNNNNDNGREPYVVTNSATNTDNDSARLRGSVDANGSSTYAWFEYGTDDDNLRYDTDTFWVGDENYSEDVSEYIRDLESGTKYYYRVVARNDYGTDRGSIRSFTTDGNSNADDQPYVITLPATLVSTNSALLNGSIDPNGAATSAWFEWGFTPSLGFETIAQSMGSGNNSLQNSYAVTSLVPNTTYYFRAVAQNAEGRSYGSILSFRTAQTSNGGGGGTVIINNTTTGGNGLSCVVLVPALNVSELDAGNDFVFTVTYRNGCNYNLSNAFLKVILPTEVTFDSTNYPFFNRDANGISYNLGVLSPGMQASISISGRVQGNVGEGNTLIFSSVLNFNDQDGDFQSVSAYLSAVVGAGRTLGANILEAFGDLFNNWLFLLILLFVALFLIWWIFFKEEKNGDEEVDPLRDDAHTPATAPRSV